jgi:hypothetical protein
MKKSQSGNLVGIITVILLFIHFIANSQTLRINEFMELNE